MAQVVKLCIICGNKKIPDGYLKKQKEFVCADCVAVCAEFKLASKYGAVLSDGIYLTSFHVRMRDIKKWKCAKRKAEYSKMVKLSLALLCPPSCSPLPLPLAMMCIAYL